MVLLAEKEKGGSGSYVLDMLNLKDIFTSQWRCQGDSCLHESGAEVRG